MREKLIPVSLTNNTMSSSIAFKHYMAVSGIPLVADIQKEVNYWMAHIYAEDRERFHVALEMYDETTDRFLLEEFYWLDTQDVYHVWPKNTYMEFEECYRRSALLLCTRRFIEFTHDMDADAYERSLTSVTLLRLEDERKTIVAALARTANYTVIDWLDVVLSIIDSCISRSF